MHRVYGGLVVAGFLVSAERMPESPLQRAVVLVHPVPGAEQVRHVGTESLTFEERQGRTSV
jgi:hypothetical protein